MPLEVRWSPTAMQRVALTVRCVEGQILPVDDVDVRAQARFDLATIHHTEQLGNLVALFFNDELQRQLRAATAISCPVSQQVAGRAAILKNGRVRASIWIEQGRGQNKTCI
jgi:hypothetical protein